MAFFGRESAPAVADQKAPRVLPDRSRNREPTHRAAATLREEDIGPEDMTAIRRGWLGLVKEKAYSHPGWHYEMPPIRGQPPRGSFRLDRSILAALGKVT